jgi:threonine synthase
MIELRATPLVHLGRTSRDQGNEVYAKLESANPTGSHKDRESLSMIQDMLERGAREAVIASTGNAAISLAALAPCEGIKVHVFVSKGINEDRLALISAFEPELHLVEGTYDDAVRASEEFAVDEGLYNGNPGSNARKNAGDAVIGEEINSQMRGKPADYVVVPSNNGTLLSGVWGGVKKSSAPKMIAATAKMSRLMGSIAGYHRFDGAELDRAISESSGKVVDVSDLDAAAATRALRFEGIFCEPAAGASLAALQKLEVKGKTVVLLITGTAFKFLEAYTDALAPPTKTKIKDE